MAKGIGIAILLVVTAIVVTEGSYLSTGYRNLGIKLSGHGIRYLNYYYGRKCGLTKLYGALSSCNKKYGGLGRCFPALYKKGYLGKRHVYRKHGRGYGLGVKFIQRGIVYHNQYYRFRHRRRHCMRYLTHCYHKYHKSGICMRHLTSRGFVGKPHSYNGSKTYKRIHKGVHRYNVRGLKAKYYKLHGFKLNHRQFLYGGHAYHLRCGTNRFYSIWNRCYSKIGKVGRCFGLLQKHRLFYAYKGKGHSTTGYRLTARYLKYHGPALHNRRFFYKKRAFGIKCSPTKWYGYWNNCYHRKHSIGGCLGWLHKKHLFYLYKAKQYLAKTVYHQKKVAAYHVKAVHKAGYRHVKAINTVAHHHVKKIKYVANAHVATVAKLAKHHLHKLHSIIKTHLYNLKKQSKRHRYIKEKQHKQHMYQRNHQNKKHLIYSKIQNRKHKAYIANAIYGLKARYIKYHGFNLVKGGFSYGGKGYHLDCSEKHWYKYWSNCYSAHHDVGGCLHRLRRQHLVHYVNAYEGASEGYGDYEAKYGAKETGYAGELTGYGPGALYLKSHGIKLVGNAFNYHGRDYVLTCSTDQWYGYWNKYYAKYHSVSGCLKYLHRLQLFHHKGYSANGYAGYVKGLESTYLQSHGFKLSSDGIFNYGGKDYRIRSSRAHFYGHWNKCYGRHPSVKTCFNRLYKYHLFNLNAAKQYLAKTVYHQKKVAAYHVKAVHKAGYRHVKAINTVAHHHVNKIKHVANAHVATVAKLAKHHLHKLHSIIKTHLYNLKKQSRRHRYIKEKQHKQHMYQREHQNKKHLIYSKIQNGKHKAYIANAIYGLKARYVKYHGFNLVKGGFSYGGKGYHLDCSERHWYKYWSNCYSTHHDVAGCLHRLRKQHLVHYGDAYEGASEGYGDYEAKYGAKESGYAGELTGYGPGALYLKSHGIRLVGNTFNYHGKDYALTCSTDQWYGYWNKYYAKYHSVSGCLKYLHRLQLFHHKGYSSSAYSDYVHGLEGPYLKSHGFKLSSAGIFNYGGKDYRIRSSPARFYGYWNKCYGRHHSVGTCFNQLQKYHLFNLYKAKKYLAHTVHLHKKIANNHVASIYKVSKAHVATMNRVAQNHVNNLKRTAHVHVANVAAVSQKHIHKLHTIVKAHLNSLRKQTQTHLYAKEAQHRRHQMQRERQNRKHLMNKEIQNRKHKAYLANTVYGLKAAYLKYHGFKLHHGGFTYRGRGYHLSCSKKRWYTYWSGCYKKYSSVSGCVGRLGKLGLLSHQYPAGYAEDGGHGSGYDEHSGPDYNDYNGHGTGYDQYDNKGYDANAYQGYFKGLEDTYLQSHGFKLAGGIFNFGGKAYSLRCSTPHFYGAWNKCYTSQHSVRGCFDHLYKSHLFSLNAAKNYLKQTVYLHKKIANNHIQYTHKVAKAHIAAIHKAGNAHVYKIKQTAHAHVATVAAVTHKHIKRMHTVVRAHLNNLRKQTLKQLHAKEAQHRRHLIELARQNKQHLVQKEIQNRKHKAYLANTVYGLKATYLKYHGFKLHNGGFTYGGKGYHITCSQKRWYQYWSGCYRKYSSESGCVGRLGKLGLLELYQDYGPEHGDGYEEQGPNAEGYAEQGHDADIGYGLESTYFRYHGLKLGEGGIFSYGNRGYKLLCNQDKWYTNWNKCYGNLHSVSGCLGRLRKLHLYVDYKGNGLNSYDYGNEEAGYGLESTYLQYHGMKIHGGKFSYGNRGYKLLCSPQKWYTYWNNCYGEINSVSGCMGRLRNQHLYVHYQAANLVKKAIVLHKKIAAHHVKAVHNVAKVHLAAMHKAANGHLYNIKKVAHAHAATVAVKAKQHIHRFNAIIKAHLNKLKKQTHLHLLAKENQHRRHHVEREKQNIHQLRAKDILNKKHKKYLADTIYGLKTAYLKYHGLPLANGGFTFHGRGYHLKCSEKHWYGYWNTCYQKQGSISGCIGHLGKLGYLSHIPAVVAKKPIYEGYDEQGPMYGAHEQNGAYGLDDHKNMGPPGYAEDEYNGKVL